MVGFKDPLIASLLGPGPSGRNKSEIFIILFGFDSRLSKLVSVPGSLLGLVFYLQREQRIVVGSDDREELTKAFFDHILKFIFKTSSIPGETGVTH